MHRLLNLLGLLAFVAGAAVVGYVLYLVLAGMLGFNPWGQGRPVIGPGNLLTPGSVALLLLAVGWLLARVSARLEWRRRAAPVAAPGR